MSAVVEYTSQPKPKNRTLTRLKVAFVAVVLLFGSATAIMSFHTDAQIPKVFEKYYEIFFGKKNEKPLIIHIPYSIGLAAGIIGFFNHFAGTKLTDDPTPIEVEMNLYDRDVNDTVQDVLEARRFSGEPPDALPGENAQNSGKGADEK
jgi:stage V sporulation protein AA